MGELVDPKVLEAFIVRCAGSSPVMPTTFMKTLKAKKREFKFALNKLCHRYNVMLHGSPTMVYKRGKCWDVSYVQVNTHPNKSAASVGMKLLHK